MDANKEYTPWIQQDTVQRRGIRREEHERGQLPASEPASMGALGALGVLSPRLAEEMTQAGRFRNVLSHTYGNIIDHELVYNALQDLERYGGSSERSATMRP